MLDKSLPVKFLKSIRPKLKEHLAAIEVLLKVSQNKDEFYTHLIQHSPKLLDMKINKNQI